MGQLLSSGRELVLRSELIEDLRAATLEDVIECRVRAEQSARRLPRPLAQRWGPTPTLGVCIPSCGGCAREIRGKGPGRGALTCSRPIASLFGSTRGSGAGIRGFRRG